MTPDQMMFLRMLQGGMFRPMIGGGVGTGGRTSGPADDPGTGGPQGPTSTRSGHPDPRGAPVDYAGFNPTRLQMALMNTRYISPSSGPAGPAYRNKQGLGVSATPIIMRDARTGNLTFSPGGMFGDQSGHLWSLDPLHNKRDAWAYARLQAIDARAQKRRRR